MTQVQDFEIGAGFLIILATFAVMFFLEKKATTVHLVMIALGGALAGLSNLQVTEKDFTLSFTQQVAQQTADTQTAITQLTQEVAALQQQNQQTTAALKALANAPQAASQVPETQAIIQNLESSQNASVQRQTALNQSLLKLRKSTANLAATASMVAPPPK